MPQFRPAGLSDTDSDSDEYFYGKYSKSNRFIQAVNSKKKIEINLQDAILNGNLDEVKNMLHNDLKDDVNVNLDSGWTLLMHACFHAQEDIVKLLLNMGADPNQHCDSMTAVMVACSNSSANNDTIVNIVSELIKHDCILNVGDKYGQTCLMRAIGSGRVVVAEMIMDKKVNIEIRDNQGWTALFWAVHHNQPEILEMLINRGARLTEVDRSGRTAINIAESHEYNHIIEILEKYIGAKEVQDTGKYYVPKQIVSWQEFYPGANFNGVPSYSSEIPNLLYGMGCERLTSLFEENGMDLKTFLLLEESDMIKLGIDMPYERQRLKQGLRNFHIRGWKMNSVAGLYARKIENYNVLDCLTTLGAHLHQVYILETTLQYIIRDYVKVQNQMKYELPNSTLLQRMKNSSKKIIVNIKSIRREGTNLKKLLTKISKSNSRPADLVRLKSTQEVFKGYLTDVVIVCTVAVLAYNFKTILGYFSKK